MSKLTTKLYHFKVWILGDKELENEGKVIPCQSCDTLFKSYTHYSDIGMTYDGYCNKCIEVIRNANK